MLHTPEEQRNLFVFLRWHKRSSSSCWAFLNLLWRYRHLILLCAPCSSCPFVTDYYCFIVCIWLTQWVLQLFMLPHSLGLLFLISVHSCSIFMQVKKAAIITFPLSCTPQSNILFLTNHTTVHHVRNKYCPLRCAETNLREHENDISFWHPWEREHIFEHVLTLNVPQSIKTHQLLLELSSGF